LVLKLFKLLLVVLFNEVVPEAAGYINDVLTKKTRDIIGHVLNSTSVPETAGFLDKIWGTICL
jgi:DNA-directed RNA polymerase subunit beta'